MNKILIVMLMFGILLFGCLGEPQTPPDEPEEEEPDEPEPVPNPTFTITGPNDGQVIMTTEEFTDLTVSIAVQNLVVKPPGGSAEKGYGHFHFTLDDGSPIVVSSKTHTLSGISPGEHTLKVELMNNDHTQYSPPIVATVSFTVEEEITEYQPKEIEVVIKDFAYEPEETNAMVGDTIVWNNEGRYPRAAICEGAFDTGMIAPGESKSTTLDKAISCDFFTPNYPSMVGKLTVTEPEE
jgi:plastocyanin